MAYGEITHHLRQADDDGQADDYKVNLVCGRRMSARANNEIQDVDEFLALQRETWSNRGLGKCCQHCLRIGAGVMASAKG